VQRKRDSKDSEFLRTTHQSSHPEEFKIQNEHSSKNKCVSGVDSKGKDGAFSNFPEITQ
jgi:hypothetical protein